MCVYQRWAPRSFWGSPLAHLRISRKRSPLALLRTYSDHQTSAIASPHVCTSARLPLIIYITYSIYILTKKLFIILYEKLNEYLQNLKIFLFLLNVFFKGQGIHITFQKD